jgi:hypothetical protein
LKTKQKNLRLDIDVIEYIEKEAAADGRNDGNYLSRLIRSKLMPKPKKAVKLKKDMGEEVGVLPLTTGEHSIFSAEIEEWRTLYPSVNIGQELNKMRGWLNANPTKKKTKAGINKFINSWLSRQQDKGGQNDRFQASGGNGKEAVARQLSDPNYAIDNF